MLITQLVLLMPRRLTQDSLDQNPVNAAVSI